MLETLRRGGRDAFADLLRTVPDVAELEFLDVRTRAKWRAWLARHHKSSRGVWLVFHKAHTGVKSLSYDDFVREAHCFGWIDSLVKRLSDDRFAIKVTPRKPASKWSDINRRRWMELNSAGLLKPAGKRGASFKSCREPSAATLSSGSTSQNVLRLARRIRESIALLAAGKKL